jgi:hypothetical protein
MVRMYGHVTLMQDLSALGGVAQSVRRYFRPRPFSVRLGRFIKWCLSIADEDQLVVSPVRYRRPDNELMTDI